MTTRGIVHINIVCVVAYGIVDPVNNWTVNPRRIMPKESALKITERTLINRAIYNFIDHYRLVTASRAVFPAATASASEFPLAIASA